MEKIKNHIKNIKIPLIFAFIFSFALIIGKVIYNTNDISTMLNIKDLAISFICVVVFTIFIGEILYIVFKWIKNLNTNSNELWKMYDKKYFFVLVWVLIFISWIPAYLSYYPGTMRYDSLGQTEQAIGNVPYTRFHPPIHTFIWQICLEFGNYISIDPLVIYSILQMIFLSFTFAKLIKTFINKKTNNWIILGAILFFTLNPVIATFSFSMTKDVCFAGFLLLFTMQVFELIDNSETYLKSPGSWILFCITALLTCLFRNNAIYVFVIWAIITIIILRKYWNMVAILFGIPICLYSIINYGIYSNFNIAKGLTREAYSVPIQQIARVVHFHDNELDEKMKEKIDEFIAYDSMLGLYNPRHADPIKSNTRSYCLDANKKEFFAIWFQLFKKYPLEYISAFLSLNLPYWYFNADTIDKYSNVEYIESGIYQNDGYKSEQKSKIPWLKNLYDKVVTFEFANGKPIIENLFSITTPFWISMFTVFVLIYKKHYKYILVVIPILLLWLTHMAGPVSNFRYVFPIIIQYPLLITLIFYKKDTSKPVNT